MSGENTGEAEDEGRGGSGGGGSGGGRGLSRRLLLDGGGGPAHGRKLKVGVDWRKLAARQVFCQRSSTDRDVGCIVHSNKWVVV